MKTKELKDYGNSRVKINQRKRKVSTKELLILIISALLILLWTYTELSKLADLVEFKRQLTGQVFSRDLVQFLFWFIPSIEIFAAVLLLFKKTISIGLLLSSLLMFAFSAYIILILAGYYPRVPCSCGGVLKAMGWQTHLWFNLFFLSITIVGLILNLNSNNSTKTTNAHQNPNQALINSNTQTRT